MIFTLDPGVNGEGSDHLLAFFEPELEADSLLFDASVFADSACLALLDSAPLLSFDDYSLDDFLPHVFADFVSALDSSPPVGLLLAVATPAAAPVVAPAEAAAAPAPSASASGLVPL